MFQLSKRFVRYFVGDSWGIFSELIGERTEFSWPTMPLNTDGIDPAGSNITIRNVNITNYDDAVAVKPSHRTDKVAKDGCSQDILVENVNVKIEVHSCRSEVSY